MYECLQEKQTLVGGKLRMQDKKNSMYYDTKLEQREVLYMKQTA